MQNAYFNHPRNSAGLSASISGTGWVVRKDVIDRKGFDFNTITEDYEMTIGYAIDGDMIAYCPAAVDIHVTACLFCYAGPGEHCRFLPRGRIILLAGHEHLLPCRDAQIRQQCQRQYSGYNRIPCFHTYMGPDSYFLLLQTECGMDPYQTRPESFY